MLTEQEYVSNTAHLLVQVDGSGRGSLLVHTLGQAQPGPQRPRSVLRYARSRATYVLLLRPSR